MSDSQLSLLHTPEPRRPVTEREKGQEIVRRMGDKNASVLREIRIWLRREYAEDGEPKSADDGWRYLEMHPDRVRLLSSTNALGALFTTGDWKPVGWTRSERKGSHGNLLRTWVPL